MITYKRRKTKKFSTIELAKDSKIKIEDLKKDSKAEFQNVSMSEENNEVVSEKVIFTKEEMVEDSLVDSTMIILCDHDEEGVATEGGSQLVTCEEARKFFDGREAIDSEIQ